MEDNIQEIEICKYCGEPIENNEYYTIYRFLITTNEGIIWYGLQKLLGDLGNYLINKGTHLSSSEVVLLRPDILKAFFTEKYAPEKVMMWLLIDSEICYECYEREYILIVPEK